MFNVWAVEKGPEWPQAVQLDVQTAYFTPCSPQQCASTRLTARSQLQKRARRHLIDGPLADPHQVFHSARQSRDFNLSV